MTVHKIDEQTLCLYSHSVEATRLIGKYLGKFLRTRVTPLCIALCGDLGMGKTHLAQGIGKGFGIVEELTSPTFALMNAYEIDGVYLYHFDLYRLESEEELENIGFYEFSEGQKAIVEWADKFEEALPEETLWVTIETAGEEIRKLTLTGKTMSNSEWQILEAIDVSGN